MIIGYCRRISDSLKSPLHDLGKASISLNLEEEWLIRSIAISKKGNVNILLNEGEILKIAEEYANAGIAILYDLIFGGSLGDPIKKIEDNFRENVDVILENN